MHLLNLEFYFNLVHATVYLSIVANHVHPFMATSYPYSNSYFQHRTAPCHRAKVISKLEQVS